MTGIIIAVLYAAVVVIAILLIGLVLLQPSKGGGLGSAFGGVGEGVFGAQALSQLSKLTIILMAVFFAVTLTLAVISGHMHKSAQSLVESSPAVAAATASKPAATAAQAIEAQPAATDKNAPAQAK